MFLSHSIALPLPIELDILELLWCKPFLTAKEIHGVLGARQAVSYRAVKTILTLMQAKRLVEKHVLHHPVRYQAAHSKSECQQLVLTYLAQSFFQGNMSNLLRAVLAHPQLEGTRETLLLQPLPVTVKQVN